MDWYGWMAVDAVCGKGFRARWSSYSNINNQPNRAEAPVARATRDEERRPSARPESSVVTEVRVFLSSAELGQTEMGPLRQDGIGAEYFGHLSKLTGPNGTLFSGRFSIL